MSPERRGMRFVDQLTTAGTTGEVQIRCPAKVNLFLKVTRKRSDGYHEVQNVMQAVTLFDVLRVRKRKAGVVLKHSGREIPGSAEENLVFRAADLFLRRGHGAGGVEMELRKMIPVGAGLGGGSSDGACCLLALNELFGSGLMASELKLLASELGSDCPFFIEGGTAVCTGRGDVVRPLRVSARFGGILVTPEARVETAAMYSLLEAKDLEGPDVGEMIRSLESGEIEGVYSGLHNSFERVAFRSLPELRELKRGLEEAGAGAVILCGSGPTLLGFFPGGDEAESALGKLTGREGPKVRLAAAVRSL